MAGKSKARNPAKGSSEIESRMKRQIVRIHPDKSIRYAGQILRAVDIGCLVVVEGGEQIVGILTERDIVQKVVATGIDPVKTLVRDVMTRNVVTLDKGASLKEAARLMDSNRIKKLPVTDNGRLIGILTMTDLLRQ